MAYREMVIHALGMPVPEIPVLRDTFSLMLKEKEGGRVAIMGFDRGHMAYIASALYAMGHPNEKRVLHGVALDMMNAAGVMVQEMRITDLTAERYGTVLQVRYPDGRMEEREMAASDAFGFALTAGVPILMEEHLVAQADQDYQEKRLFFPEVRSIQDVPLRRAQWIAAHGNPGALQKH